MALKREALLWRALPPPQRGANATDHQAAVFEATCPRARSSSGGFLLSLEHREARLTSNSRKKRASRGDQVEYIAADVGIVTRSWKIHVAEFSFRSADD